MKIFKNANIITLHSENERFDSLVVESGKFIYVGNFSEAISRYPHSEVIDCKGQTILPGFNDSHMHLLGLGMGLNQLDLSEITSIEEMQSKILDYSKDRPFIYGRGWNQDNLAERRMPTRDDLDCLNLFIPIILVRACGHILVSNTIAMQEADIYKEDGIFREKEMDSIRSILPEPTKEDLKKYIEDASNELLKYGVTSIQTDDLSAVNESAFDLVIQTFQEMDHVIRIYEQTNFNSFTTFMKRIPNYKQDRQSENLFRFGPIKILGDGSLGAHTAKLIEPYSDQPDLPGILNFSKEELQDIVSLCHRYDLDVAIHAIGDQMLENALDAIGNSGKRDSIVHSQITNEPLLQKIKKTNVILHIQPVFLNYDMHIAESRLGENRIKYAYNYKTLSELDVPIAFGTDSPVEPVNPFFGIYSSVTRKDRNGYPADGWYPEESLTLYQALKFYTSGSAYASYDENNKGRIIEGQLADFLLIEHDPFKTTPKDWLKIKVSSTYVGGVKQYEDKN